MFLATNTSTSLQTTLAADAHLAEGQFSHEEQTLNNAKTLIIILIIIISLEDVQSIYNYNLFCSVNM
jgi:hypothetical protein